MATCLVSLVFEDLFVQDGIDSQVQIAHGSLVWKVQAYRLAKGRVTAMAIRVGLFGVLSFA